jgi:hypothetical protein
MDTLKISIDWPVFLLNIAIIVVAIISLRIIYQQMKRKNPEATRSTRQRNTMIYGFVLVAVIGILSYVLYSRDVCEELNGDLQQKRANAEAKYGSLIETEVIPCETRYLNINLKEVSPDKVPFDSIHMLLYDSVKHDGWPTLLVFDPDGKYLFSHSPENKIYKQTGD